MSRCVNAGKSADKVSWRLVIYHFYISNTCFISVEKGQDVFVVREMFPADDGALSDSGEEEDYYFSDNDCI